MTERTSMSDSETELQELGEKIIEEGAVALTASEDLLEGEQLLLKIHRPANMSDGLPRTHDLCDSIDEVLLNGERYSFDYEIDPDPPQSLWCESLYVADEIGTKSEHGCSVVPLEEGIDSVALNYN